MTSKAAPAPLTPQNRVYDFVLRSGAAGVTDEDIFRGLGQSVTARADRHRRSALVAAGLIVDSGTRRLTSAKRRAVVWKAARVVRKLAAR